MYMPAQIQLKMLKMVEIEPESDVPRDSTTKMAVDATAAASSRACRVDGFGRKSTQRGGFNRARGGNPPVYGTGCGAQETKLAP